MALSVSHIRCGEAPCAVTPQSFPDSKAKLTYRLRRVVRVFVNRKHESNATGSDPRGTLLSDAHEEMAGDASQSHAPDGRSKYRHGTDSLLSG